MEERRDFDVVIMGGGFAGLALARQLSLQQAGLSIAVVDKAERPLPRFTLKVGESVLSPQGYYLAEVLKLTDYMNRNQVRKWGVRFFFPSGEGDFASRPEVGAAAPIVGVHEWQYDRGKLENDLRAMAEEAGAALFEGYSVKDLRLGDRGERHEVTCEPERSGAISLRARWVVDASGRRRLIHRGREENKTRTSGPCSAAWFRVKGWVDVEDFVDASNKNWKSRIVRDHSEDPNFGRVNSTVHLTDRGYWVWLIALPDGGMSIGIVGMESIRPFEEFNTLDKAMHWIQRHEPTLASHLKGVEVLDFKLMRGYSYPAGTLLSANRWACVGEAFGFSDPFYSPGGDAISVANSLVTGAILADRTDNLTDEFVEQANALAGRMLNSVTRNIHAMYPCLGHSRVAFCKVVWDFASTVLFSTSLLFEMNLLGVGNLVSNQSDRAARTTLLLLIDEMSEYFEEVGKELAADPKQAHLPPHSMADHIAMLTRCHQISTAALTGADGQPPPPTWGNYLKFVEATSDGIRCYLEGVRSTWSERAVQRRPSSPVAESIRGAFQETLR